MRFFNLIFAVFAVKSHNTAEITDAEREIEQTTVNPADDAPHDDSSCPPSTVATTASPSAAEASSSKIFAKTHTM